MTFRRRKVLVAVLSASLALGALAQAQLRRSDVALQDTRYAFGTLLEIVVHAPEREAAQDALIDTAGLLQDLHRDWHAWRPGALSSLNQALAQGQAHPISPRLAALLLAGQRLACESSGLFDPAMGRMIALWGFHADTPPEGARPSPTAIAALRDAAPRMADLSISEAQVTSTNPAVQLDLGGYGKGAALDATLAQLISRGISTAVLNAGGDVHVLGSPNGRPWRVAIRDPFVWGAMAVVPLAPGEGLYTSGNYERYFEQDNIRFSHILDPRTGAPVQEIVSASVIHPEGQRADAAATALSVAGATAWAQTAADMGITTALLITQDGRLLATPAMAQRLEWTDADLATRVEVTPLPAPRRASCAAASTPTDMPPA